jgi:hypothetical protein
MTMAKRLQQARLDERLERDFDNVEVYAYSFMLALWLYFSDFHALFLRSVSHTKDPMVKISMYRAALLFL